MSGLSRHNGAKAMNQTHVSGKFSQINSWDVGAGVALNDKINEHLHDAYVELDA